MRGIRLIVIAGMLISFASCGENTDRIRERASIESQEAARKQIEAENSNRDSRVDKAEQDLERRRRLIDALVGKYEGAMTNGANRFQLKLTIGSSLPPYSPPNRVRSPEEVDFDLNNLFLNIQASILAEDGSGIGGCAYESVRPGFENGKMALISKECRTNYNLQIADDGELEPARRLNSNRELPGRILAGTVKEVLFLTGQSQSIYGISFEISLRRSR